MSEELLEVKYYELMNYKDSKAVIKSNINQVAGNFVAIGYYLKHIRDKKMYQEDGYENIWDLAQVEFGISKSQASKFMAINDKFSKDGNSPILLEQYREFSSSKLSEMLYLTDQQLEQVTIGTTVAQIREIKNPEKAVSTSKQETVIEKPSGQCIHRPEYPCTLPEASKLAQGNGIDCHVKCCWNCEKHRQCGYECNSSAQRPVEVKQELQCIDKLAAYWCKREMTVELYELAKLKEDEDIEVFVQYFEEKYIRDSYAPAHSTPGYEISFRTDKNGIHFDDEEKTGYSWQLLMELVCQEAENETPASKPVNFHENSDGLKRLKEIRKQIKTKNNSPYQPEIVDNEPEIVNDVDEVEQDGLELDCFNKEEGWHKEIISAEPDPVETVEADIVQTVPEELPKPVFSAKYHLQEAIKSEEEQLEVMRDFWKTNQPDTLLKHETILIALKCNLTDMEYPNPEPVKPVQPELPILKNNDQRKEFIDAYTTWPIWIDLKETGERYYRYDLSDKVAMVVKVSKQHIHRNYKETKDIDYGVEQYYLLGIKAEWHQTGVVYTEDATRTFYECSSNKSQIVDYLKYFQKKGA